jgi:EAL domain-containing protein (putative c-di-GMP-specific phosphodiesterase class I)
LAIVRLRPGDLEQAVEAEPQVELKTSTLAGVEAFVRRPHAVYGMIGPSDIIPLVEQAGLHSSSIARSSAGA